MYLSDGNTILGDLGGTKSLLDDDIATLGTLIPNFYEIRIGTNLCKNV